MLEAGYAVEIDMGAFRDQQVTSFTKKGIQASAIGNRQVEKSISFEHTPDLKEKLARRNHVFEDLSANCKIHGIVAQRNTQCISKDAYGLLGLCKDGVDESRGMVN